MKAVRVAGFVVLVIVAVVICVGMKPDSATAGIALANAAADANADLADSAPQQSVANGWETNDLLEVIAEQQEPDDRVPALLVVAVAAIAWGFCTSRRAAMHWVPLTLSTTVIESGPRRP